MSFYDDASLVFLPSGGAGKDGKAYSIKPVPEYGTELVTNGGFDTDSDWNLTSGGTDANISNGKANFVNAVKGQRIQQNFSFTAAKTYKVVFTVSNYTSGLLGFYMGGVYAVSNINANGTYTYLVTPTNNAEAFLRAMQTGVSHNFSVDDISVIEVVVGDGDFTFSRGSNLTATRVDSNGLIEKGRENLLKQSNSFDTTWGESSASATNGQSGYDGSSDAWLITKTGSHGRIEQNISASGVQCVSVYAKAATSTWLRLVANTASFQGGYFDLSNGVAGDIENAIDTNIEDIGLGWYRCSVLFNGSTTRVRIYPSEANSSSASSGSIYIQDAQLEQGLVATEYIESGATTGLAGILEDSPRFDYSGGASCPSLLLEGGRTNLFEQSEYYEDTFWEAASAGEGSAPIITTNYATSPEGVKNATRIQFNASSSGDSADRSRIRTSIPMPTDNVDYTQSFYIKSTNGTEQKISFLMDNSQQQIMTVTSEWQRFDATRQHSGATGIYGLDLRSNFASTSDILVYGAQLEQGSYPTSYIPNHSGGSVTRSADSCSGAGDASTFNDSEGVLYAEIAALANDGTNKYISINNGGTDDYLFLRYRSDNRFQVRYRSNNTDSLNETFDLSNNLDFNKIAVSYKLNEFKIFVNGSQIGSTNTSGTIFNVSVDNLDFESFNGGSNFYGKVKQLIVFNTTLSTTDCEILTGTSYESFSAMATALNYTTYE